jgi:hypothetical protein
MRFKYLLLLTGVLIWIGIGFCNETLEVQVRFADIEFKVSAPKVTDKAGEKVPLSFSLRKLGQGAIPLPSAWEPLFDFAVFDSREYQARGLSLRRNPHEERLGRHPPVA